jgi:IS1 family transposase
VRATTRLPATSKATVLKLLVEMGEFCSIYQDHALRNLKCQRVEIDEIWAYVSAKKANATKPGQGDLWTYTAIDADSKLMLSWLVGSRNHENTRAFMLDVSDRLANRVQITTDGLKWYVWAVENAFGLVSQPTKWLRFRGGRQLLLLPKPGAVGRNSKWHHT